MCSVRAAAMLSLRTEVPLKRQLLKQLVVVLHLPAVIILCPKAHLLGTPMACKGGAMNVYSQALL